MTAVLEGDLRRLARRVMLMVGRGRVTSLDDTGPVQVVQARLGADQLQDGIARLQEFGIASRPPVGTDLALVFVAGDRGNPIIVASNNQELRLKLENDGEVALYDAFGKSVWLKKDGGIVVAAGGQPVAVSNAESVTVESSGDVSVTAGGDVSVNGDSLALAASGKATLSAGDQVAIEGSTVRLGAGGDLATMSTPARSLFNSYASSGPSAVLSNPVSPSLASLKSTLTGSSITTGLDGLVTAGSITPTDETNIVAALTGTGGLLSAANRLQTHTDRLAGLQPTIDGTQPTLDAVIGAGAGLDYTAAGIFGTSSTAIPAMTTGLGAATAVTAANTYITGIVALLTADPTQVPTVISTIGTHATTLNGYAPADTAAFASAQANVTTAGNFLGLVALAKNNGTAMQALMAEVASPTNIATLRTI